MLITNAQIWSGGFSNTLNDVRIIGPTITQIGKLAPSGDETVLDANGAALLPGLHDHHIHIAALSAQRSSVLCGPPHVTDIQGFSRALQKPGTGWLRATGFDESISNGQLPNARWLDRIVKDRPIRVQHRTGRMWFFNSCALEELLATTAPPPGLESDHLGFTGRLFDDDIWLQQTLGSAPPDFTDVSRQLARFGVTGITDMSPRNDAIMARHFAHQRLAEKLLQNVVLAGALSLAEAEPGDWSLGPAKLHLHESALPDFEDACAFIRTAHDQNRSVAVHCVTEVELVFTLALFENAGCLKGDRIEHVSVASPDLIARMAHLGLMVCVQPHFIAERGDHYLANVEPRHHSDLYRLTSLKDAGIAMAGGSDAPYGSPDPWMAMAAGTKRTTPSGVTITPQEALTPEQAISLYLADPLDLSRQRQIIIGSNADLCVLQHPWETARNHLCSDAVVATIAQGRLIYQRVDQPPL